MFTFSSILLVESESREREEIRLFPWRQIWEGNHMLWIINNKTGLKKTTEPEIMSARVCNNS